MVCDGGALDMIFQHTIDKVLSGEKTQTRRIVKPGEEFYPADMGDAAAVMHKGFSAYRLVYEVGRTYAIQPGRGKPAVARMRITDIRREDVREISWEDADAEGFVSATHFLLLWTKMHDPEHYKRYPTTGQQSLAIEQGILCQRPAERYQAWALTFEVVK